MALQQRQLYQRIFMALFCLAAIFALMVTPYLARFELRSLTCETRVPEGVWLATLGNFRHLFSYSLLLVFARIAFPEWPLTLLVILVLLVSVGVEVEQSIFDHGHCRLRDMLPNLIAVSIGLAVIILGKWLGTKFYPNSG